MDTTRTIRRRGAHLLVGTTVALLLLGGAALASGDRSGYAAGSSAGGTLRLSFDVAEDGTRFVFDDAPLHDDGLPAYGNSFVTEGYILEAGTLGAENGLRPDGTLDEGFEDAVIGRWTCYGTFVGDGAHTAPTAGAWVVTTQIYEFEDGSTLVTVGPENPAGGPPTARAIVGGTGRFALARGEVSQLTLGHNASDGVNASFVAELPRGRG